MSSKIAATPFDVTVPAFVPVSANVKAWAVPAMVSVPLTPSMSPDSDAVAPSNVNVLSLAVPVRFSTPCHVATAAPKPEFGPVIV